MESDKMDMSDIFVLSARCFDTPSLLPYNGTDAAIWQRAIYRADKSFV
jgi:hypothetical protein